MMIKTPATDPQSPGPARANGQEISETNSNSLSPASPSQRPVSAEEPEVHVRVVKRGRTEESEARAQTDDVNERLARRATTPSSAPDNPEEEPEVHVQVRRKVRVPDDEDQSEEDDLDDRPVKRVRRRKRKRVKKQTSLVLTWLPWVAGITTIVLTILVGTVLLLRAGHGEVLLTYGISLAIMLPISTVILVISMFISSAIAGGIDFGEAHTAILKAVVLLLVVNLIGFLAFPCSLVLVLPVWLFGLMWLFDLDLWEARFLFIINLLLNSIVRYFLLAVMIAGFMHGGKQGSFREEPEDQMTPSWTTEDIIQLGGSVERDLTDPGEPIVGIVLQGAPIGDEDLRKLRGFPQLRRLDLANTQITDDGLLYLGRRFSELQSVKVTGTQVTPQGVKAFRKLMPNVRVIL